MKIRLWQLMALTAWLGLLLAIAVRPELSIWFRSGWTLTMLGLLMTIGRSLLPSPEPRKHIENEAVLSKVFDSIFLNVPAFFILWSGISLMVFNPIAGFLFAAAVVTLNLALLWHQNESGVQRR